MFKKLFFTSLLLISITGIYYPSKIEKTELFDYCYSLEKILFRNSIQKRKNMKARVKSLSEKISRFGVNKTRGSLTYKMINQYKASKNYLVLNVIPNKFYCFAGYWVEKAKPGTFESIIYDKSKKTMNEFKDFKDEVEVLIDNLNSEYQNIREEFNFLLKDK